MNRDLKKALYIGIGVAIFIMVAKLFIKLLPWLIVAGGIVYVVSKIKSASEEKKLNENTYDHTGYNRNSNQDSSEIDPENYTNGEVIDVDYEDVEKK